MKRHLFLAIALLCSVLGLTVCVETAFADGCCNCCCCCCCCTDDCAHQSAGQEVESCQATAKICSGQDNQKACLNPLGGFAFVMSDFPKSCVSSTDNVKCDEPLSNCYRGTTCQWYTTSKICKDDPNATGTWISAKKKTTNDC